MARIVIAGCGYVGGALAARLAADGHSVWGIRRKIAALPPGVEAIAADLGRRDPMLVLPERIDAAVYCVGPDGPDERAYRTAYLDGLERFLRALREQAESPRVFFTSSTSVYGQTRGEWIDEESPADPPHPQGEILVMAERLLGAAALPSTVVRFGGIYGPGRTRLIEQVRRGRAVLRPGPPHYTNRIHRDDAASALRHLIALDEPAACYLGVDCEPASETEVLCWLAQRLGQPRPRELGEGESVPPRRTGSKRCRNDRLRGTGFAFEFPTFREGYAALIGR